MRLSVSTEFVGVRPEDNWIPEFLIKCGFDYYADLGCWRRDIDDEGLAMKVAGQIVKRGIRITLEQVI